MLMWIRINTDKMSKIKQLLDHITEQVEHGVTDDEMVLDDECKSSYYYHFLGAKNETN
jgi:hypothetical protein